MISIQNLYKSYPCEGGDFEALRNISINIQSGEIFGIIGLSGAGKSTLLRTLNRLEEPSSGSICIGDTDITQLSTPELRKLRRRVGMIFQHFNLLTSRTVFQNVAFPLEIEKWETDAISKRVTEVLDLVDLSDKAQAILPSSVEGKNRELELPGPWPTTPACFFAMKPPVPLTLKRLSQFWPFSMKLTGNSALLLFLSPTKWESFAKFVIGSPS